MDQQAQQEDQSDSDFEVEEVEEGPSAAQVLSSNASATHSQMSSRQISVMDADPYKEIERQQSLQQSRGYIPESDILQQSQIERQQSLKSSKEQSKVEFSEQDDDQIERLKSQESREQSRIEYSDAEHNTQVERQQSMKSSREQSKHEELLEDQNAQQDEQSVQESQQEIEDGPQTPKRQEAVIQESEDPSSYFERAEDLSPIQEAREQSEYDRKSLFEQSFSSRQGKSQNDAQSPKGISTKIDNQKLQEEQAADSVPQPPGVVQEQRQMSVGFAEEVQEQLFESEISFKQTQEDAGQSENELHQAILDQSSITKDQESRMGIHEDPELDFLDNLSQISSVMHPEKIIRDKSYNDLFEYNPVNTKGQIPVLNKETSDQFAYDIEHLLHPKTQQRVQQDNRYKIANTKDTFVPSKTNFIKKNMQNLKPPPGKRPSVEEPPKKVQKVKSNIDVNERFYEKMRLRDEKIQKELDKKEKESLSECTFKPQITPYGKPRRTIEEFLYESERFERLKNENINQLRQDDEKVRAENEGSYHPQINQKSIQLLQKKDRSQPVYEQLYNSSKSSRNYKLKQIASEKQINQSMMSEQAVIKLFQPELNAKSKRLKRNQSIGELLYDDAMRRISDRNSIKKPEIIKFQAQQSEKVLLGKFEEELNKCWEQFDDMKTNKLNYTLFSQFLRDQNFINPKKNEQKDLQLQAWQVVTEKGKDKVEKQVLFKFLKLVMHLQCDIHHSSKFIEQQQFGTVHDSRFEVNEQQVKNIQKRFKEMYLNRVASRQGHAKWRDDNCTFKPQINPSSQQLQSIIQQRRSTQGESLQDYLYSERKEFYARNEEIKLQNKEKDLEQCTFAPRTRQLPKKLYKNQDFTSDNISNQYQKITQEIPRQEALYKLSQIKKQKVESLSKNKAEQEMEKNIEECSFTPDLTSSQLSKQILDTAEIQGVKGAENVIQRYTKAREEKSKKSGTQSKNAKNMVFSLSKDKIKKKRLNKPKQKKKVVKIVKDFDILATNKEDNGDLIITVCIDKNTMDDLEIKQGEDPQEAINLFLQKHKLGAAEQERLIAELKRVFSLA